MAKMKCFILLVACVVLSSCCGTRFNESDPVAAATWKRGYLDMTEAEELLKKGEDREAMFYFERAIGHYNTVREKHPAYEPELIDWRIADCEAKITEILAKHANDITFYSWKEFNAVIQEVKSAHSAALKKKHEEEAKRAEAEAKKAENK